MLSLSQARSCYDQINQSSLNSLKNAVFRQAIDYAQLRCQWQLLDRQQRQEIDERRTIAHNTFIDSINILSRNMAKQGEDINWRATLGDDRKIVGDFACYIVLFLSLQAR